MSIFDHPDDVPPVATWRCPHCATLQPESTRCWACERTPTTCATCRYFRKSVIGPVGFCGLDRARAILSGEEVRPCWQAPTDVIDLVSDRPGSGRTSWLTLAERQRGGASPTPARALVPGSVETDATSDGTRTARRPLARGTPAIAAVPVDVGPREPRRPVQAVPTAGEDDLIEAPLVPPARKLTSEAQRRSRARRERQWSADLESGRERLDPPANG